MSEKNKVATSDEYGSDNLSKQAVLDNLNAMKNTVEHQRVKGFRLKEQKN